MPLTVMTTMLTGHESKKAAKTDPVHKLKHQIEFAPSPERITHLNNVLVFETAQQPQLTQRCVTYVLIVCMPHTHTHIHQ